MPNAESDVFTHLRELVSILSTRAPQKRSDISKKYLKEATTADAKLFRSILRTPNLDESTLVSAELGLDPNSNAYRITRSRLRQKLLDSLFALDLDIPESSENLKAQYRIRRKTFMVHTLRSLAIRSVATWLAEQAVKEAMLYEEWWFAMELYVILREIAALEGRPKLHKQYADGFDMALAMYSLNERISVALEHTMIQFARGSAEHPELLEQAQRDAHELVPQTKQFDSWKLRFAAFRLQLYVYQIAQDYEPILPLCDEIEAFLEAHPVFFSRVRRGYIHSQRVFAFFDLRRYHEAEQHMPRLLELFVDNDINYYLAQSYNFLLHMHTERYDQALEICDRAMQNLRFPTLSEEKRERWQLFHIYAEYAAGKHHDTTALEAFTKEMPIYSKDKAGFNVAVIALQILVLLEMGDKLAVIDKIESLRLYRQRHLKGSDGNGQADFFFRLLNIAVRADFDPKQTEQRAKRLREKFSDAKLDSFMEGIQIIPFTTLWDKALEAMKSHQFR